MTKLSHVVISLARLAVGKILEMPTKARIGIGAVLASTTMALALMPDAAPIIVALSLCLFAVVSGIFYPTALLIATLVWLPFLGLVRRLPVLSVSPSAINPLLIVAPVATFVLVLALSDRAFRSVRGLGSAVFAFNVLVALSALNPIQGRVMVGVSAAVLILVPMLWFWIGRVSDSTVLETILPLILFIAIGQAIYGLGQMLLGFPEFDQKWIDEKGYPALRVGEEFKAFGSFSSAYEYVTFLGIGLMILWVTRRRYSIFLVVPGALLLTVAIFLESTRAIVFLMAVALVLIIIARRGVKPVRAALAGVLGVLLVWMAAFIAYSALDLGNQPEGLIRHQLAGIARPFDSEESTLDIHFGLMVSGLSQMKERPFGSGPGVVTIAGEKLGGEEIGNTELDFSNAAVAFGIPGFILFTLIFFRGCFLAYDAASRKPDLLHLSCLGILIITASQWLNGGQYSVAPLPWLFLGWLYRQSAPSRKGPESERDKGSDPDFPSNVGARVVRGPDGEVTSDSMPSG